MIIDNAGTYTLRYTATDDCGKTTTVDRELVVEEPVHVYGIKYNETSHKFDRTGDAKDFGDPIPQVPDGNGGWIGGSSPFDDIYPWSGMQIVEDAEAGTLVSIPKFYYRWTGSDEGIEETSLEISQSKLDGFLVSPAHADRGDGVGERDVVYIARYHCAINDIKSISGAMPDYLEKRSSARTKIHNLGADIWQHDLALFWTIRMLYVVEFCNFGGGEICSGFAEPNVYARVATGMTDSMTYHTGTTTQPLHYGYFQYRHIENLWANVSEWIDGIYFNNDDVYAIKNPSEFSDNSNGVLVGKRQMAENSVENFIQPIAEGYEYARYPNAFYNADGFGFCRNSSTGTVLFTGASFKYRNSGYGGLMYFDGTRTSDGKEQYVGYRLMKLPSA